MKLSFLSLSLVVLLTAMNYKSNPMETKKVVLYPPVASYIEQVSQEFDQIPAERRKALKKLALFVESKAKAGETAQLVFICTHNSRRSHIAQIWAETAAAYYGVSTIDSYSGGTEATAFNPRAVKAMEEVGFKITETTSGDNPVYRVQYTDGLKPIEAFSKKFSHESNPTENFCAVMTCSEADKNCPVVPGASLRLSLPYEDPKDFDGTPQESAKYRERVHQIAREILYAFSLVNA